MVEALGITDGKFQIVVAGQIDQLVGFFQGQRNGFFQENMLAGGKAVAGHRIMRGLRCRRYDVGIDSVVFQEFLIIRGRCFGTGLCGHFLETVRVGLGDVNFIDQGAVGARMGPNAAAPTGADKSYVYWFHEFINPQSNALPFDNHHWSGLG